MKKLLGLLALLFATTAQAQTNPCPTVPTPSIVQLTDTTLRVEQNLSVKNGVCRGAGTLVVIAPSTLRYRTTWAPCIAGEPWRQGALYTTMANAMTNAARPPACGINETISASNSAVVLNRTNVLVGDTITAVVTLRNAQAQKVSPNKVVTVTQPTTVVVNVLPVVVNADSTYTVRLVATVAGTGDLRFAVGTLALTTRSVVVSPRPVTPPVTPPQTGVWQRISPPINLGLHGADQFGFQAIAFSPANPNILYLGTCYEGIWKSTNRGDTWFRVSTGTNGPNLSTGRNWSVVADPTNADVVYALNGYGNGQGIWKSVNGGVDWTQLMSQTLFNQTAGSIYNVSIDPANNQHLLVGFHQGWAGTENSGVMESLNGGATWTLHQPQGFWGKGNYALFIDSNTWLLATQEQGFWRTANAGATWTQVVSPNVANMPHGAGSVYKAANGAVYTASSIGILRSTNNGATWTQVGPRNTPDGYMSVVGDGTRLYTQRANTGNAISGPLPYYTSLESDGVTWVPYNTQTFTNGPLNMVVDRVNGIIYSSNWMAGVWRLNVGGTTTPPPVPVDTTLSLTNSTFVLDPVVDSIRVTDSVTAVIVPRTTLNTVLSNRTVRVTALASDGTSQVFNAVWNVAANAYRVAVSSPVATTLTLQASVGATLLPQQRTVRVVTTPVVVPPTPQPTSGFVETFTGAPAVPTKWNSDRWDVQQYSRDLNSWIIPTPMNAQHGPDCAGPPLTHPISTYDEHIFSCRDHMMTSINEEGYGAIVLTPNHMLDWSTGEAVFRMNINTAIQTKRDWWMVWFTPWEDRLSVPAHDWAPGLNGYPRNGFFVEQSANGVCAFIVVNHVATKLPCDDWRALSDRMAVSFSVRDTVEVRVSRTRIRVSMPKQNFVFADVAFPTPLAFTSAVVQLAHDSYNPTKDAAGALPNTWHWDDVIMDKTIPFTIIRTDKRYVNTNNGVFTLSRPAPANAFVQFGAAGFAPQISFNGGATWITPVEVTAVKLADPERQYRTPIPQGTTTVQVRQGTRITWWPGNDWIVRDMSVWAR